MTTDDAARIGAILSRLDYLTNEADARTAEELLEALPTHGSPGAAATMDAVLWAFERRLSPSPTPRR